MVTNYNITIKNRTGGPQSYLLFAEKPSVGGGPSGTVWTNVMKQCPPAPSGGVASFEMSNNYFAICGSYKSSPQHGGRVNVYKTLPVKLGTDESAMASTVGFSVLEGCGSCDLASPVTPGKGKRDSFMIDTGFQNGGVPFTERDARENNLFVGVASSKDGDTFAVMSTFTPHPNSVYNIYPQTTFYVVAGERLRDGNLVHSDTVNNKVAVDFGMRGTNRITLVHQEDNTFEFQ
ncbi:hypothetical protein Micbo1qcDRAFT_179475 [Microdochium bolleyi]|uniref:Uncharacterized protein n=1 Tax=Microdochium bolleyi TaxID=196109 RepID=A0A136IPK7_9PEZI|nr:hypothetical protein Micbo1qcDRAFT_179475 [Microdochium bolleyi]